MPEFIIDNHQIQFTRKAMGQAHQAFPREFAEWNLALKLKGKALLPGVTVREIAPAGMTEGDKTGAGLHQANRSAEAEPSKADHAAPTPAPASDAPVGEFPKWKRATGRTFDENWICRLDSAEPRDGVAFRDCGKKSKAQSCWWGGSAMERPEITPTEAAKWLRENGHPAEAARIEADRFEPVGVDVVVGDTIEHPGSIMTMRVDRIGGNTLYGPPDERGTYDLVMRWRENGWRILKRPVANALEGARVWVGRDPETDQWVTLAGGSVVAPHYGKWIACSCGVEWTVQTKREITGTPAAKEALASLARWMEVGGE